MKPKQMSMLSASHSCYDKQYLFSAYVNKYESIRNEINRITPSGNDKIDDDFTFILKVLKYDYFYNFANLDRQDAIAIEMEQIDSLVGYRTPGNPLRTQLFSSLENFRQHIINIESRHHETRVRYPDEPSNWNVRHLIICIHCPLQLLMMSLILQIKHVAHKHDLSLV